MTDTPELVSTATAESAAAPAVEATPESRLQRIESALAAALNINLHDFDGQDVVAARKNRIAEAAETAAEAVKAAFVEADLTVEQRLARVETALKSGGTLS